MRLSIRGHAQSQAPPAFLDLVRPQGASTFPRDCPGNGRPGSRTARRKLGLSFRIVSRELNELEDEDPCWWALGKLHAYRYLAGIACSINVFSGIRSKSREVQIRLRSLPTRLVGPNRWSGRLAPFGMEMVHPTSRQRRCC